MINDEAKKSVKEAFEQLHWLQNVYPQIKEQYFRSKADYERAEKRRPEVEALLEDYDLLAMVR